MAHRIIKRSRVGTYHLGHPGAQNVTCNQNLYATPAKREQVEAAPAHMFCDKCFGKKPATLDLDYFFS